MKNLIIVRSGNGSLHSTWMANKSANWDIECLNYDTCEHVGTIRTDLQKYNSKTKFETFSNIIKNANISDYNFIWFVDDDIEMNSDQVEDFFRLCQIYKIDVAQPSLSPESYTTHPITLKHGDNLVARRTNFVEVMAPCFSNAAIERLKNNYEYTGLSGWGLELYWINLLNPLKYKWYIFDSISVTHTKPVGGPDYSWMPKNTNAETEMRQQIQKLSLNSRFGWYKCNLELVKKDGTIVDYENDNFFKIFITSIANYYRKSKDNLKGIYWIRMNSAMKYSFEEKNISALFQHATFGEYIIMQVNIAEWIEEFENKI